MSYLNELQIADIVRLQMKTVEQWHEGPVENRFEGFMATVCTQHQFNYGLWHEEDIARSPDVSDAAIAEVKRKIDRFNQQRNDWIEKVDDAITDAVESAGVTTVADAPLNTETPGSVIDRLSIMSLRIYHLDEQLQRDDASDEHRESVRHKIAVCRLQQAELANSLQQLIDDIFAGRKKHRTYRQFKMYNDPTLNPYLYGNPTDKKQQVA